MTLKSDDAEIPVTDFLLPNRWGTAAHNLKNHVIVTQLLFMVVYSTSILILEIPLWCEESNWQLGNKVSYYWRGNWNDMSASWEV